MIVLFIMDVYTEELVFTRSYNQPVRKGPDYHGRAFLFNEQSRDDFYATVRVTFCQELLLNGYFDGIGSGSAPPIACSYHDTFFPFKIFGDDPFQQAA